MAKDTMDPASAVTWGPFVQAAYDQYVSDPGESNPSAIKNMPSGYTLERTIQMSDFIGPATSRVFYGFVAVGGNPATAVVALRGTATKVEWWDDLHWNLVPFTRVSNGGRSRRASTASITPLAPVSRPSKAVRRHRTRSRATSHTQPLKDSPSTSIRRCPSWSAGHSLGGALATLLVADTGREHTAQAASVDIRLAPTWAMPPSPPATALSVPCPGGSTTRSTSSRTSRSTSSDNYQPVTTGYAINSLKNAKWSLGCCHALNTYLHVLSPTTVTLNPPCQHAG